MDNLGFDVSDTLSSIQTNLENPVVRSRFGSSKVIIGLL